MEHEIKTYGQLQIGDVIFFHGANVKVIDIKRTPYRDNLLTKDECKEVISFEIEPADDEAVEILGRFYSHGWYGGNDFVKIPYTPNFK